MNSNAKNDIITDFLNQSISFFEGERGDLVIFVGQDLILDHTVFVGMIEDLKVISNLSVGELKDRKISFGKYTRSHFQDGEEKMRHSAFMKLNFVGFLKEKLNLFLAQQNNTNLPDEWSMAYLKNLILDIQNYQRMYLDILKEKRNSIPIS